MSWVFLVVETVLIVLGVLLISFLFAPIGLGGGLLYVPLFHYIGGWEIDQKLIRDKIQLINNFFIKINLISILKNS